MIELFSADTPNGKKITIMLEEIGYDYKLTKVDLNKGEQFNTDFKKISPFNKIPVITEPSAYHAILSGHGENQPTLEYLPDNYNIVDGEKVYTSGKEGIFSPGIPIGEVKIEDGTIKVVLFSNLDQITFVNVKIEDFDNK